MSEKIRYHDSLWHIYRQLFVYGGVAFVLSSAASFAAMEHGKTYDQATTIHTSQINLSNYDQGLFYTYDTRTGTWFTRKIDNDFLWLDCESSKAILEGQENKSPHLFFQVMSVQTQTEQGITVPLSATIGEIAQSPNQRYASLYYENSTSDPNVSSGVQVIDLHSGELLWHRILDKNHDFKGMSWGGKNSLLISYQDLQSKVNAEIITGVDELTPELTHEFTLPLSMSLQLSPGESKVAFISSSGFNNSWSTVNVYDLDTGEITSILEEPRVRQLSWLSDSEIIAEINPYSGSGLIVKTDLSGNTDVVFTMQPINSSRVFSCDWSNE